MCTMRADFISKKKFCYLFNTQKKISQRYGGSTSRGYQIFTHYVLIAHLTTVRKINIRLYMYVSVCVSLNGSMKLKRE